jgi:hypothetical protein
MLCSTICHIGLFGVYIKTWSFSVNSTYKFLAINGLKVTQGIWQMKIPLKNKILATASLSPLACWSLRCKAFSAEHPSSSLLRGALTQNNHLGHRSRTFVLGPLSGSLLWSDFHWDLLWPGLRWDLLWLGFVGTFSGQAFVGNFSG